MTESYFYIQYNPERPLLCKYGHTTKPEERNRSLSIGFTSESKYIFLAKLEQTKKYKELDMYKIPDKIIYNIQKNPEYIKKIQNKFNYKFDLLLKEITKYLGKGKSGKELIFVNGIQFLKNIILQDFSIMGITSDILIDKVDNFMDFYTHKNEDNDILKNNKKIKDDKKDDDEDDERYEIVKICKFTDKQLGKNKKPKKDNKKATGKYHCPICDKKYNSYQGMWIHKKKKHKKGISTKNTCCKFCDNTYSTVGSLNRHLKTCKKNPNNKRKSKKISKNAINAKDNDSGLQSNIHYLKQSINAIGFINSKILEKM